MSPIRIVLADDHILVRKGLRSLLDQEKGMEVVAEADDGREAIQIVEKMKPDVVVMDISMPRLNGLDATRRIKKKFPKVKVLILTMHSSDEYIYEILDAGASGYILKKAAPNELVLAIQTVNAGDVFLSPAISSQVIQEYVKSRKRKEKKEKRVQLTDREREILQLIAEGHSNRKIADLLFLSIKTVETHRYHIMNKLSLHNTAELANYAAKIGLVDPRE